LPPPSFLGWRVRRPQGILVLIANGKEERLCSQGLRCGLELDKWDAGAASVRQFVTGLEGNAGAFFLVDRAGGRALTLTLWTSEAAAVASDAFADQSRARTIAATGVQLLERGQYEVVDDPEDT